jgi:hypothetical protein
MDDNTGPGSAHSLTPSEPASRTLSGSKRPPENDETTQNKEKVSARAAAAAGAGGGAAAPVSSASFLPSRVLSSPAFGFGSQSAFAPSAGFSGSVTPAFGLNSPPPLSLGSAAGGGGRNMDQISQLARDQEKGFQSLIEMLGKNKVITEEMKNAQSEFRRKESEVMACLSLLQRTGPDRFTRTLVALNSVKRPVIAASWPHLKPILTGVIEDMNTDEFMRSFSWAFTEQVKGRLRMRRGDLSDQEIQRLLTNGFDMLVQEAFSDSISILSAIPTAVNQFLFDDNPAAIGGAIAGNMLLQWAGTEVLAMLANNIIGYITFGQMNLYSVMENFRSLYSLSHQEVLLTEFSNLLITVFRVPVMMVEPYIAYLKQFTLDQIRNMIATIAIASINLGYGKRLAERGINNIKVQLNINEQAGLALLDILPDVPGPLGHIVDFSRIVLD